MLIFTALSVGDAKNVQIAADCNLGLSLLKDVSPYACGSNHILAKQSGL